MAKKTKRIDIERMREKESKRIRRELRREKYLAQTFGDMFHSRSAREWIGNGGRVEPAMVY